MINSLRAVVLSDPGSDSHRPPGGEHHPLRRFLSRRRGGLPRRLLNLRGERRLAGLAGQQRFGPHHLRLFRYGTRTSSVSWTPARAAPTAGGGQPSPGRPMARGWPTPGPMASGSWTWRMPALEPAVDMTPYQTLGDWAWVPGVAWGQDGRTLYFVDHGAPTGLEGPAASPAFDLAAQPGRGGPILKLAQRTGMFAYPSVSPARQNARRRDRLPARIPSGAVAFGKPDQYVSTGGARPRWKQPDGAVPCQRRSRPGPPARRVVTGRVAAWIGLPG